MQNIIKVSLKLELELPYALRIPGWGVHPKGLKAKRQGIHILIAVLLTTATMQSQPGCPLVYDLVKAVWGMENILRPESEIVSFVAIWMELEDTVLSEINQTQEDKYCTF